MMMEPGRCSGRLEKSKYHSCLQEGRFGELQARQLHLSLWKSGRENPPGKHFQLHEGQEGDQE